MMRRRSGGYGSPGPGPVGVAARSLLAVAFGLAVAVSPLSMISCPHHGALSADAAEDRAQSHAAMVSVGGQSDDSDSQEHAHGACCCLGQCCPGGFTAHPASDAGDALPHAAVVALARAIDDAVHPTPGPWLLPWPNGPPSTS